MVESLIVLYLFIIQLILQKIYQVYEPVLSVDM